MNDSSISQGRQEKKRKMQGMGRRGEYWGGDGVSHSLFWLLA